MQMERQCDGAVNVSRRLYILRAACQAWRSGDVSSEHPLAFPVRLVISLLQFGRWPCQ